jgi:hypothetical protein
MPLFITMISICKYNLFQITANNIFIVPVTLEIYPKRFPVNGKKPSEEIKKRH